MKTQPPPPPEPSDHDGELLAAYLDCDLDPQATAALEARLAAEPQLVRQLDAIADALFVLVDGRALDPPPGLSARLANLSDSPPLAVADKAVPANPEPQLETQLQDTAVSKVVSLQQHRSRAGRWDLRVVASVAAAFVAVTVVGGIALRPRAQDGSSPGARNLNQQQEAAADLAQGGDEQATRQLESALAPEAASAPQANKAPSVVQIVEVGTEVATASDLRTYLQDAIPSEADVSGTAQNPDRRFEGDEFSNESFLESRQSIEQAPAFTSGVRPARCLDAAITAAAADGAAAQILRVESLRYADNPALLFVIDQSRDASEGSDSAVAVVIDPANCAVQTTVAL